MSPLVPDVFYGLSSKLLDMIVLPRRHREIYWIDEHPIGQSLIEVEKKRVHRLSRSLNELEREVWGCSLQINTYASQSGKVADPFWHSLSDFGSKWWMHWKSTLERARKVQVPRNDLTKEFREARRIGLERDPSIRPDDRWRNVDVDDRNWGHYQLRCCSRHKWGQYLRSNMDWDWDLGACMQRLFIIEKQTRVGPSPDAQATTVSMPGIDVDARTAGTLKISMGEAQGSVLKEVHVTYKTTTGETQYLTFTAPCPSPGNPPVSKVPCDAGPSTETVLCSTDVQQFSGNGLGSFDGEREIEDLEAGAPSSFASHLEASEIKSVSQSRDGYEGKGIGFHAVWVEGDTISICSLD